MDDISTIPAPPVPIKAPQERWKPKRRDNADDEAQTVIRLTPVDRGGAVYTPAKIEPHDADLNVDRAVAEAIVLLKNVGRCRWRLGELADQLDAKYGLKEFAERLGVAACTAERWRDVYRAYKDADAAPGRLLENVPYAVLRELAAHDDRLWIIEHRPNLTKREAAGIMRKRRALSEQLPRAITFHKGKAGRSAEDARPLSEFGAGSEGDRKRRLGQLLLDLGKAEGRATDMLADLRDWSDCEPDSNLMNVARKNAEAWAAIRDHLEGLYEEQGAAE